MVKKYFISGYLRPRLPGKVEAIDCDRTLIVMIGQTLWVMLMVRCMY